MANTIKIKSSSTASAAPSNLEYGELALNYNDGKLYYKNSSDQITYFLAGIQSVSGTTYTTTIGNGVDKEFTISHNLGTRDVAVVIRNANAPYESIDARWEATNSNTLTLDLSYAPSSNSVRVIVYAAVTGASYPSLSGSMYSGYHGNGVDSTIVVNHELGTRDTFVQIRNANSPYESYNVAWEATGINSTTVYFDSPPALNSVYIMIYAALSGVASTSLQRTY